MYLFADLRHSKIEDKKQVDDLFNISENLFNKNFEYIGSTLELLKKKMHEDNYYVIHNYVIKKGSRTILKGKTILTDKASLLEYIEKGIDERDVRPLRIIPYNKGDHMIYVDDEGVFFLYH